MSSYATFEHYNGKPDDEGGSTDDYKPIEIQSAQHKKKILTDNGLVVVLVYGKSCGPCIAFKPKFAVFASKNLNKCYFAMEDVDIGLTPNISAVPSMCIYRKERLVHVIRGGNLPALIEHLSSM